MTLQRGVGNGCRCSQHAEVPRMEVDGYPSVPFSSDATSVSPSQDPTSGGKSRHAITVSQSFVYPVFILPDRSLSSPKPVLPKVDWR